MHSFLATVRQIIPETPDTVTLVLEADTDRDYRAGQFLNIDPHQMDATRERARELELSKGRKERPRAYSLASAPHEPHLAITIKGEPDRAFPSLMSRYFLEQVRPGDLLPCAGFAGLYTLPDSLPPDAHIVHLCAGSGIVPNYAIIKDALHRGLPNRHTLLYSNRSWENVIFRHSLAALAHRHPGQLDIVHSLTRESLTPDGTFVGGRIREARILQHVPSLEDAWFFICGPSIPTYERAAARARGEAPAPRFLESMKALLLEMGVQKQRIHYEGW